MRKLFPPSSEVTMTNLDFGVEISRTILRIHWKSCFIRNKVRTQARTTDRIVTDLPKLVTRPHALFIYLGMNKTVCVT